MSENDVYVGETKTGERVVEAFDYMFAG